MKIRHIHAGEVAVPLKTPFKTAVRTVTHVLSLVLKIETDDSRIGHGEAPSTAVITGDLTGTMRAGLAVLAPQLAGQDLADFNACLRIVEKGLMHHTSLKAALEMALFDLRAQSYGMPLYKLLGGGTPKLKTDVTISVNDAATMVADCRTAVDDGFDALKVKVGGRSWREDVETTIAIRKAIGPDVAIRLDANQGWTPKHALRVLAALEQAGVEIELVEQPVKADDIAGLRYITERTTVPIMADEAVFGATDAIHLLSTGSADILNIKLMKTGGISQAIEIAQLARRFRRTCMIGCMLEGVISVTAAAHFAVAHADVVTSVDLDGPQLCVERVVHGGLSMLGPWIELPDAPGLGIERVDGLTREQQFA
ncbi:MAG: dipeptide epimerase [Betaproteobacteria bacterium]|nr:dipeptide epimerase [Betaproteobacteria bacterium]